MARDALRVPFAPLAGLLALAGFGACGVGVDLGGGGGLGDGGNDRDSATCAAFAPPEATAPCGACSKGDKTCQPNGCFNGYLCDVHEQDCKAPGTSCDGTGALDARSE
jgi:hypothetical protein